MTVKSKLRIVAWAMVATVAFGAAMQNAKYPPPLYPVPPEPPQSVAAALPFARKLVRLTAGRTPLGWVKSGQRAVIFTESSAWLEPNYYTLKAMAQAFRERQVAVLFVLPELKQDWVQIGPSYDTDAFGWSEAVNWIEGFSRPEEARAWLRKKNPQLWEKLFAPGANPYGIPKEVAGVMPKGATTVPDRIKKAIASDPNFTVWKGGNKEFFDQYDQPVDAIFAGSGGRPGVLRGLGRYGPKLYGNFVYSDYRVAMEDQGFPGDVRSLVEERMMEPIAFVDQMHYTDPEGTDLTYEVDKQTAELWALGAGAQQGHIFMYPHGASMLRPSMVWPNTKSWVGPLLPLDAKGVLAGTRSHAGVYPRMEIVIEHKRVKEVRGGGPYGDILRAFLDYPPLNDQTWPYYKEKGYWFLYEGAYGTNPKAFLQRGRQSSEREHSGVTHWALGTELLMDPPGEEGLRERFRKTHQSPGGHSFHVHNGLSTLQAHIRGTDRWVTIAEKGRLTALDNPETRAVAAKYGDPDEILSESFRYDLPGINSPGNYQKDYAGDPWKYMLKMWNAIESGTYAYLNKQ